MTRIVSIVLFIAWAGIVGYTAIGPAMAGWTCQQQGNMTYCYNYQTGQSYTCQQVGNQTYCN
jgi:hypothetical protein